MRRIFGGLAVVLASAGIAACGSSHHLTAQDRSYAAEGQKILLPCLKALSVVKIKSCITPPGSGPKFQACVTKAMAHGILTKRQRELSEAAVGQCVVNDR